MSNQLNKKSVARNYIFLGVMLASMVLGALTGWLFPQVKEGDEVIQAGATVLKPLGTLFINLMFCIVVPMVFASISGSIATMKSRKRAGKIMGTTILTFVVTGAIAAATPTSRLTSAPSALSLTLGMRAFISLPLSLAVGSLNPSSASVS